MEHKLPQNFSNVRVISSEISDGSMDNEHIEQNLPKFLQKIRSGSANPPLAYCEQVHGDQIKIIKRSGKYPACDGLMAEKKIGLFVKSADCIPLLFFCSKKGIRAPSAHGAIHVGRRSLMSGIISKSLKVIFEETGHSPAETLFFLGPHIRKSNYEVKRDIINQLPRKFHPFLAFYNQKYYFDLTAAAISELETISAKEENVLDCGIDTFSDRRFFSYRGKDEGLFASLIIPKQPSQK